MTGTECACFSEKTDWKLCEKKPIVVKFREVRGEKEVIKTREGELVAYKNQDFIIEGVDFEIYPIKKEIFYKTYKVLGRR